MNLAQKLVIVVTLIILAVVSAGFDVRLFMYRALLSSYQDGTEQISESIDEMTSMFRRVAEFFISEFLPVLFVGSALFIVAGLKRKREEETTIKEVEEYEKSKKSGGD